MRKKKFNYYFLKLSIVCVVVFIMQVFIKGFTESFVLNNKALNGEVWRFVTAIFLHGSLIHLIYNLFALLFFGVLLERLIGSKKFFLVFFGSGIIANIVSVNFYNSSLGASGAVYGIIGCLAILKPFMMVWAFGLVMPMFAAAIFWTLGGIIGLFVPSDTGHIAHLSGIGIGFLVGLFMRKIVNKNKKRKPEISDAYIRNWEDTYMRR